jgi:hypothetical protein
MGIGDEERLFEQLAQASDARGVIHRLPIRNSSASR